MGLLDDILTNKELGDDSEFEIGNHKVKLGDLRGELAERDSRYNSAVSERDNYRQRHDELSSTMTRLLGQANESVTRENNEPPQKSPQEILRDALSPLLQNADPSAPLFEDKVFGSFANRLKTELKSEVDGRYKELADNFATLKDMFNSGMQAMTAAQVQQDYRRWYDSHRSDLPNDDKGKRASLDQITQYAARNGMYQINGQGQVTQLLDLDRALDTLTQPTREQKRLQEAEQAAYQKGLSDARTERGKVLPFFGDRSGGPLPKDDYKTEGKSARQIVRERLQQGLADLTDEAANNS